MLEELEHAKEMLTFVRLKDTGCLEMLITLQNPLKMETEDLEQWKWL